MARTTPSARQTSRPTGPAPGEHEQPVQPAGADNADNPAHHRTLGWLDGAGLDAVDRRIVEALLRDGRLSVAQLAQRAHVARATAYARFERLRQRGVVRGFRADVDPAALGLTLAALVLVRAEQRGWRQLRHDLRDLPGVHFLGLTTGPADFVLLVRARDTTHLRDVILEGIQSVPGVRDTQTVLLLEEDGHLG